MLRRVLLTALTAGMLAGLLVSVVQSLAVRPLILEAERYENPAAGGHQAAAWAPRDGAERVAYTVLADVLTGVGFAMLLAAAAGCAAIYWVIDPKLRAVSSEYEQRQSRYVARLEQRMKWDPSPTAGED